MEDPVLVEAGLRLAGPCPDGRAAHPAASAGCHQQRRRAEARRPQTVLQFHARRATSELRQHTMRTPIAGGSCIMTGTGRSGGTQSPGRPVLFSCQPEAECARGPEQERPRPQEQSRKALRDRARPKPRSTSRLCFTGALRGVPARRGRRRRETGSGAGEGFPHPKLGVDSRLAVLPCESRAHLCSESHVPQCIRLPGQNSS